MADAEDTGIRVALEDIAADLRKVAQTLLHDFEGRTLIQTVGGTEEEAVIATVRVLEGELDYGLGPWVAALVIELDHDGLIARETRYYAEKSEPPPWRSAWTEPLE